MARNPVRSLAESFKVSNPYQKLGIMIAQLAQGVNNLV